MLLKTSEKMWGKNYHLDPVKFLSALAWQAAFKKIKLELLNDIDTKSLLLIYMI